jgi:ubiquinone/menaquinone biosynthesis C-methylase UbiE
MSLLVRERRPRRAGAGKRSRRLGALEQERSYWANRAPTFSKLEWASRQEYLRAVVKAGGLQPADIVLDAGTGTGLIARAVAPHVAKVTGIDISPEMMDGLQKNPPSNCEFIVGDIRCLDFSSGCFSKVFARMVFHSLMDETGHAARECHRVLQAGGRFILSEGIPPAKRAGEWYTQMFRLKEQRLTFFPDTLEAAVAKLLTAESAITITNTAMQIHGALGYSCDLPIERMVRDARMYAIGGGTAQILRNVIASRLLPREYSRGTDRYAGAERRPR